MAGVLLATASMWPELFADDVPLLHALRDAGIDAAPAIWDDATVDWASADLVIVRSIWDYTDRREEFNAWVDLVETTTPLHNPARILRWNGHKSYLRDLEARGVPIVPTEWIARGARADLLALMRTRDWDRVVVKPAVSAGARNTISVTMRDADRGQRHLDGLLAIKDVMVQPYIEETEAHGEHSLVHFGGVLSHCARKDPALATENYSSSEVVPVDPLPDELDLAQRTLAAVGEPLMYARVDSIVIDGRAHLMELEAIEPQLFLRAVPEAVPRLVEQVLRALEHGGRIT